MSNAMNKTLLNIFLIALIVMPMKAFSVDKMMVSQADGYVTHRLAASVVTEAYRRLGIATEFVPLPSKRSMTFANLGKVDAEVGRIEKALDALTNLLKVDTPLTHVKGVAIVKNAQCDCNVWSDLKDLRIGIRRGEVYAEKATEGMSVLPTSSYHQLFSMLNNGRIDVAVGIFSAVDLELNYAFKDAGMTIVGKPLIKFPLYHLIHKKHAALIPQLNDVLLKMTANGDIEKIFKETRNTILIERQQGKKRVKVFK